MRILIFHGYLLSGTGSNVYNASLARTLAALGHEVHLVCQDRSGLDLGAGVPGSVEIHNPDIGGLLPVFVHDSYEGFEVKTFAELSDAELEAYIERNVEFVRELVDRLGGVDAALANHLVMGPVILVRAGLRYALKVHGSDLSYTVLSQLERFGPYAVQACNGANGILVGSSHIAERLREAVDDPDTNAKVRLGPPGVDTDLFAPIPISQRRRRLSELAAELRASESTADASPRVAPGGGPPSDARRALPEDADGGARRQDPRPQRSAWDRDPERAATALDWFAEAQGPRVIFVGKLIVSKGVDLLLAAWPLVVRQSPAARLLVVGFGSAEQALKAVVGGFAKGDLGPLHNLAERGRGAEGGEDHRLSMLSAFLGSLPDDYTEAAQAAASGIRFAGRLEHGEVATPVAASDALVFPSTFPEAFGMVAAEAASAGALPVSAAHSGAAEVSRELVADLPEPARALVSFELDDQAIAAIAACINEWLALTGPQREAASRSLRETVDRLWSWNGVAKGVLAASAGELAALLRPQPEARRAAGH